MKKLNFLLICILCCFWMPGCNPAQKEPESSLSKEEKDTTDLILDLSVKPFDMALGYGNVYSCKVNRTEKGFVEDTVLSIVIIGSENEKDSTFYKASVSGNKLKAGFKKYREDEPYRMMPIDGFVDADNTSWMITWLEPIPTNEKQK